jgi:hypothetical protein
MMICLKDEVTHYIYGDGMVVDVRPPFVEVAFYSGRTRTVAKHELTHVTQE